MRHKPTLSYCGLTIILSQPSRFDKASLLTANGGYFFNQKCLCPEYNRYMCDIRLKDCTEPIIPGTKCILVLGDEAPKILIKSENSLNEIRGSVYEYQGIPAICSYSPQDAVDIQRYEEGSDEADDDDDDDSYGEEKRRHGRTKRSNYPFWLKKDVERVKYILKNGVPKRKIEPNYIVYPDMDTVCHILTHEKNKSFYIDIETDGAFNIRCLSFSFGLPDIYCVPIFLPDYSWAYSELPRIFQALAVAFRDNETVAHNGSGFDFFVFAYKYRLPVKKVYDTMLAQHRCFPRVEKSLGHCTSIWTWEQFHKDEGDVPYSNVQNARQTWLYCGKDVYTMILVRLGIDRFAARVPGLADAIKAANESVVPYLTTTLHGIRYNEEVRAAIVKENDRLMMQYLRMIEILVGKHNLKYIAGKSVKGMPGSNPQCVRYFHEMLGYPVVGLGKPTKTGIRNPSLGKKNLFKLRLKYNNPVIDICIAYREASRESGSLGFNPWKQPNETKNEMHTMRNETQELFDTEVF